MSIMSISPLVRKLHEALQEVNRQTRPENSYEKLTYNEWIATAEATSKAAENSPPYSAHELPELKRLELALKYRLHLVKDEPPAETAPLLQLLNKVSEELFPGGIPADFADTQIRYLCAKYPAFAKQLLEPHNGNLAINFFKFCLQAPSQSKPGGKDASHWIDIFIEYPDITERLMKSSLYEKLGRFPENIYIDPSKGVFCIKMEIFKEGFNFVHVNLKNLNGILQFSNHAVGKAAPGITLTVAEFFKQFERASTPDIDVSIDGIINLHSDLLASRQSENQVHLIDSGKWTEFRPSSLLTWPDLQKLYPEAKDQPLYGFVLRANSLIPKAGEAFFDFIMKLDNGNYRVISLQGHQKPGASLYQQKRIFYPLTLEQGKAVIDKVAKDIEHCRKAHIEGKPSPTIDVQPYIDEILAHPFYAYLQKLSSDLYPYNVHQNKDELQDQLSQVKQNLDPAAFEEFLRPVIDKLMSTHDMALITEFINTSLTTINSVLQKDSSKITLPSKEEVTKACELRFNQMNPSLLALASLCFEVLHPYRMTVAAAEQDTSIIGRLFRIVATIPWAWLKKLLHDFLLVTLGPFRGYHYKTLITTHQKTLARLAQTVYNLKPEDYINRPSQLFVSLSQDRIRAIDDRIKNHLEVLSSPVSLV